MWWRLAKHPIWQRTFEPLWNRLLQRQLVNLPGSPSLWRRVLCEDFTDNGDAVFDCVSVCDGVGGVSEGGFDVAFACGRGGRLYEACWSGQGISEELAWIHGGRDQGYDGRGQSSWRNG